MPSHPRSARRSRLLAVAVVALLLAAVAFVATVSSLASLANSAPATSITTAPATTDVLPTVTTTAAGVGADGYRPTPAGPPATDPNGQWIADPHPSSTAGGGR